MESNDDESSYSKSRISFQVVRESAKIRSQSKKRDAGHSEERSPLSMRHLKLPDDERRSVSSERSGIFNKKRQQSNKRDRRKLIIAQVADENNEENDK